MIIDEKEISQARIDWGKGIVSISNGFESEGIEQATLIANDILDKLYGFEFGPILFKPTQSGGEQTFRHNKEGALSYFVGHNSKYPLDSGFGIKFWREVKSETSAVLVDKDIAMWMGWVFLTNKDGDLVKVDKSWVYKKASSGELKIILHHSSIPYQI